MSEHLRAYLVIMGLMIPMFLLARKPGCLGAIDNPSFPLRRNLWLLLTTFAFLAHDFWFFVFLSSISLIIFSTRDPNRLALFFALLFVIPPFAADVSGFGVLNYLFSLSYPRLLTLLILLPLYLGLRRQPATLPFGKLLADKFLMGFMFIPLGLQFVQMNDSVSNTARSGFYVFLDVFLPYYVASRGLKDWAALRDAVIALVLAILLMAPLAMFEYLKQWLLYSSLAPALGLQWLIGAYLPRGNDLRAYAAAGHALSLAYLMVVGLSLYAYLWGIIRTRFFAWLGLAVLLGGIWAPVSRGPWLGALAGFAVIVATGANPIRRALTLSVVCAPLVAALLLSPVGEKVISLLPFVGTVDDFNEIYRRRLFEISLEVIAMNPLFGSFTYLELPIMQSLVQGQGIIDIVNSYIGIALTYGLVGLSMFVGLFACALQAAWTGMRASPAGSEAHTLGRSLFATLIAVMVTIAGVSSINTIGLMNMVLVGLSLSYGHLVATQGEHHESDSAEAGFGARKGASPAA